MIVFALNPMMATYMAFNGLALMDTFRKMPRDDRRLETIKDLLKFAI